MKSDISLFDGECNTVTVVLSDVTLLLLQLILILAQLRYLGSILGLLNPRIIGYSPD